ncbi:15_t:CDS:2 [Paraglomus brasilianum]|uniref:15_t:CDS:1 n=1 Tax=Paraglomus brasilianum TaxID=144538 RepID=A0A9N9GV52_9GLOM|nr:15_t:CDS:2 [Paraglomus brasilianum]
MKLNNEKIKSIFLLSLVGSGTGQQSADNQTEVLINSGTNHLALPQLVTNFTHTKMAQEGDSEQNVYVAGASVLFTFKRKDGSLLPSKKCTDDEQDIKSYDMQLSFTDWDNSVTLEPVNLKHMPFVPKVTDEGTVDLLPVTSSANPTGPGLSVCVYGAASVDLGTNGLLKEDLGAPVYTETKISERTLAQALGHVSLIENADPQHQSFYYFPIETALSQTNAISGCSVPSLTSSVNNFSQPLSETELQMAQNVSQIVERDSRLILHSGMKVDGITYSLPQTCQRPCTLSFPVSEERFSKKVLKGFLTSANCVNTNILVGDTVVGVAMRPFKFDSEQGLDYAFVRIYSDYCGRGIVDIDELLPIIPTPSQPLSVGDKVYAHGGARGMVSGEILETGVTITVNRPGSCGKESAELHDVVKVKMNKGYYSGDLGAPVYIPLQVPGSTQMIASPVGQVVEVHNHDANDNT